MYAWLLAYVGGKCGGRIILVSSEALLNYEACNHGCPMVCLFQGCVETLSLCQKVEIMD